MTPEMKTETITRLRRCLKDILPLYPKEGIVLETLITELENTNDRTVEKSIAVAAINVVTKTLKGTN